jgi:hypothetical protein
MFQNKQRYKEKGRHALNGYFFPTRPRLLGYETHDGWQIHIEVEVLMNILFIIKVKTLMLIKMII